MPRHNFFELDFVTRDDKRWVLSNCMDSVLKPCRDTHYLKSDYGEMFLNGARSASSRKLRIIKRTLAIFLFSGRHVPCLS